MDLINRQDAIEICDAMANFWDGTSGMVGILSARDEIAKLESAHPDLESAYAEGYTAAEAEFHKLMDAQESDVARDIATIIENERDMRVILKNAEHTETHSCEERTETHESRREWYMKGYRDAQNAALHESCTDCPLYDHDRHNCPRFNHVIPTAIRDAQQPRWIPVTEALPEEDGEYLVTKRSIGWNCEEYNSVDIAYYDDRFHKANKIVAWMPLPPSYKGGRR